MTEHNERITALLELLLEGKLTSAEKHELAAWMLEQQDDEALAASFYTLFDKSDPAVSYDPAEWQPLVSNILSAADPAMTVPVQSIPVWKRHWYAIAALLAGLTAGILFFTHRDSSSDTLDKQEQLALTPATKGAVLSLEDGTTLVLDSMPDGVLAIQTGAHVALKGHQLSYEGMSAQQQPAAWNKITIPRGHFYRLTLADGTSVWLNAASSLRYPVYFREGIREVELTGEAYFEVAANAHQPFMVTTGNTSVQVLGTSFNIRSYDNEPNATTLISGKVKVSSGNSSAMMSPGQQLQVTAAGDLKLLPSVDTSMVLSWKNGFFSFDEVTIQTIMAELGRWYDLEVVFEGPLPTERYRGEISRYTDASEVLKILISGGAHIKIEGKKVIVKK